MTAFLLLLSFSSLIVLYIFFVIVLSLRRWAKYPKTSFLMCLLNVGLNPLKYIGFGYFGYGPRVNIESLVNVVIKAAPFKDFGDLSFVDSYKKVAQLPFYQSLTFSNLGLIMASQELQQVLRRRLDLVNYFKHTPSVETVPIVSPVFVLGLGRSGTTYLHRLLSLDPTVRAPSMWELVRPVPKVGIATPAQHLADRKARADDIKKVLGVRRMLGDRTLDDFHEIGFDLPEECLFALSDEMPFSFHYVYTCMLNCDDFLGSVDHAQRLRAYRSYKKVLQLLTHQLMSSADKRWVLKCPFHLLFLKELMEVFPDAKIVWAHRHPVPCIASACSLLKAFHELYYEVENCDHKLIGQKAIELGHKWVSECPALIKELGCDAADVNYSNLIDDPVQTIRLIYSQFKWEFTEEYHKVLLDYLRTDAVKRNAMKKKNQNKILHNTSAPNTLRSFGLSEQLVLEKFKTYIEDFGLLKMK